MTEGDILVYRTQQWLNTTYGDDPRFGSVPEDGRTGWPTIYGLLRALQIELGIQNTANNFGPSTISKFNTKYPTGIHQQIDNDFQEDNIYAIIQGALFCKGYSTGVMNITKHFYNGTGNAIKQLKEDAGIDNSSSTVTLNIMKALMSMDYFYSYDTSTRTVKIQNMQRYLNANYESYIGLIPCDGVFGRSTNKALIYAIQAEEGMPVSVANGNFGPSTRNCCPTIPYSNVETSYYGNTYSSSKINKFSKLINMGLYAHGIGNGNYPTSVNSIDIKQFQNKFALPITGIANLSTWLSIFISCGDVNRTAKGCDCATKLDVNKAQTLYNNGYRYVGRYLSNVPGGLDKALTSNELQIIFNAGLRVFPIYQTTANQVSYFTQTQAIQDVESAYQCATNLGIPRNTVIYFAVDCDPQDTEITSNIIPYFEKINEEMNNTYNCKYKIGVYGTRNVCNRVSKLGYAVRSFVADMSTGFSGNLGFSKPDNWAFDQFATTDVGSGNGYIEIDKDAYSGLDTGFNYVEESPDEPVIIPDPDYSIPVGNDTVSPQPVVMVNVSNHSFNVYSHKVENGAYDSPAYEELCELMEEYEMVPDYPGDRNKWVVSGNKVGEIKPGDLFVWFYCRKATAGGTSFTTEGDSAHKVLFRNSDGIVRYGYIQELITATEDFFLDSKRVRRENFDLYSFDAENNTLIENNHNEIYTVKRELNYKSNNGSSLGILPIGTQLRNAGNAGATNHGYIYFEECKFVGETEWHFLNQETNSGAFVDLDMQNGVSGYNRALW